ncbi:C-type mannose receptor 2-like [Palaemon carinicauda]|uniref:C-type mannose receptor 2-like n=1 Tax=Palaemon carinicauda TaxID=392227 RepID=UPI0035B69421
MEMSRVTLLLFLTSSLGLALAENVDSNIVCDPPFRDIGHHCLVVDTSIIGTWDSVRQFCRNLGGELVNMHDANILHDIFSFIKENPILDSESYWIGAYDILDEGKWVWSYNNTHVRMNTPLWGVQSGHQEPTGGVYENCAMLNKDYHYYVFDDNCDQPNAVICASTKKMAEAKPEEEEKDDTPRRECPSPFIMIGNVCLLVDALKENPWSEQQMICNALGGHMARIEDANDLGDLYDYLIANDVRMDLWMGGSDLRMEDDWVWEDNSKVPMGTPFWGQETRGMQEPAGGLYENCLSLSSSDFFYFHDDECQRMKGVVCQYDI